MSCPGLNRDSQFDDGPFVVPGDSTPLALPSITHIEPPAGQEEVRGDPKVLIRLGDDPASIQRVRQIDPLRGRRGLRPTVSSETAL